MEKPPAIAAALMTRICGERGLDAGFLASWARRERGRDWKRKGRESGRGAAMSVYI
jgi:hypothetical protein